MPYTELAMRAVCFLHQDTIAKLHALHWLLKFESFPLITVYGGYLAMRQIEKLGMRGVKSGS